MDITRAAKLQIAIREWLEENAEFKVGPDTDILAMLMVRAAGAVYDSAEIAMRYQGDNHARAHQTH
jgi:hypothetical protein